MERISFSGSPEQEDISKTNETLEQLRQEGRGKIHFLERKTREKLMQTDVCINALNNELLELGFENTSNISKDQVHLLSTKIYKKIYPHKDVEDSPAGFKSPEDNIYVAEQTLSKNYVWRIVLHELVHVASHKRFHVKKGEGHDPTWTRLGYSIQNPKERHEHFFLFNELVVDKLASELFWQIYPDYDISAEDKQKEEILDNKIKLLDTIIDKVSRSTGKDSKEVWKNFKIGLFSGELMQLRDIEKACGRGSLRLLGAAWESDGSFSQNGNIDMLRSFFETDDQEQKNNFASNYLKERERLKYFRKSH